MTLSTLAIVGVTASIIVFKLAMFAVVVALAANSLAPIYKVKR